ncbi:M48 family metalloprotease [Nodosilinea sp. P-1105]|uniref:M48 family metallopeptidase n=1 Tax=Nodosilinea sp. P-1105 TaxID=2546229 RepID=UPI0032427E68
MRAPKRFLSTLLVSCLVALLGGQGLLWSVPPGLAQAPNGGLRAESAATEPVLGNGESTDDNSEPSLEPGDGEPASAPERVLPTPDLDPPDGTLRLPPVVPIDPSPAGSPEDPAADTATPDAGPTDEDDAASPEAETNSLLDDLEPDQVRRSQLLMAGDQRYLAGDKAAAATLYGLAKDATWLAEDPENGRIFPLTDPEDLPPAGRVYWREAQAGADSGFTNRVRVPLELLVKDYPEFLPGQAMYARYLVNQGQTREALALLDDALTLYPYQPDLLKAQVDVQMAQEQWIEAAITANQFAILNPDHPDQEAMAQLARQNLDRFRGEMNQTLTRNLVSNIITGAAGYILTGGLLGPFSALNSGMLLMQGESGLGQQVAEQAMRQLPMVKDPEIRAYVNDMGQKLAALAGRDEFNYSFEVIMDDSLNAFALPGGKVFINAGAITRSYSEAELAGLIGHEISHAVLSHGFQMVTQGNLTASLAAFIPIPEVANIAANLIVASYSRDMERQADLLGTKLLATGGYAADGLHNLMVTLEQEFGNRGVGWFASHPNPGERVNYLRQLVEQGGFDRYAYEGVEPHLKIRRKMAQLLAAYEQEQASDASDD